MVDLNNAPVLKTEVRETAPPSPDNLTGFYDVFTANRAYERSSWNVDRYVKRMVQIIDDKDTDPRLVVMAMEILRKHALESLTLSGRIQAGAPMLPSGTVEAQVLPAADLALLEDRAARTTSMLTDSETTNPPEETNDAEGKDKYEDRAAQDSAKGGSEDGGAYDTEQVVGHRPPLAARPGLCHVGDSDSRDQAPAKH